MPQQFSNNARALLASGIDSAATSMTIEASKADLFPVANMGVGTFPTALNWFKVTLQDTLGNVEVVYVRTRVAGSALLNNLLRGQEGTTPRAFIAGSVVGLRVTALDLQNALALIGADNAWQGQNSFDQPIQGDLVGNVTGNVTGNLTGNADTVTDGVYRAATQTITGQKTFTLPIIGSLQGNANTATATAGANWSFTQVGTELVATYNGTRRFKITSTGDLVVSGNITAYGTV